VDTADSCVLGSRFDRQADFLTIVFEMAYSLTKILQIRMTEPLVFDRKCQSFRSSNALVAPITPCQWLRPHHVFDCRSKSPCGRQVVLATPAASSSSPSLILLRRRWLPRTILFCAALLTLPLRLQTSDLIFNAGELCFDLY
jgi:hypothetical protein